MILADKIIELRKRNGWSQEELAEKLNVSRQSISKWEGAQSIPDMNRIIKMSEIFGVSTDFLLKDEETFPEETAVVSTSSGTEDLPVRSVHDSGQNRARCDDVHSLAGLDRGSVSLSGSGNASHVRRTRGRDRHSRSLPAGWRSSRSVCDISSRRSSV